jgi:hypothetical protein
MAVRSGARDFGDAARRNETPMKIRSSRLTDDHGEWKPASCENLDLRGGDHGYTATNGVHDTAMMQTMR